MSGPQFLFTLDSARILIMREICHYEGHLLRSKFDEGTRGGVQGSRPGDPFPPSAADCISCRRCDVVFTATYANVRPEQ